MLLRRKAAEELKRQQEAKANERRKVIAERTGEKKNTDNMDEGWFELIWSNVVLLERTLFESSIRLSSLT